MLWWAGFLSCGSWTSTPRKPVSLIQYQKGHRPAPSLRTQFGDASVMFLTIRALPRALKPAVSKNMCRTPTCVIKSTA